MLNFFLFVMHTLDVHKYICTYYTDSNGTLRVLELLLFDFGIVKNKNKQINY